MSTYSQVKSLTRLSSSTKRPPRYKLFLLTWLAIYPLTTFILYFFGKSLNLLPLPIQILSLNFKVFEDKYHGKNYSLSRSW